jgi:DNA-binding YbaB/EbfC family protein
LTIVECRFGDLLDPSIINHQSSIINESMNIQKMMAQAQAMQSKMQEELEALRIEASSGGGMVTIEMSGTKEILSVRIDPVCVDPKDIETLQDLILAASREAARRVDEAVQKKTSSMLGGMIR